MNFLSEFLSKQWSIPGNMPLSPIYINFIQFVHLKLPIFPLEVWPVDPISQYPTGQDRPPAPAWGPSARHGRPLRLGGCVEGLELGQPAVPWQERSGCRTFLESYGKFTGAWQMIRNRGKSRKIGETTWAKRKFCSWEDPRNFKEENVGCSLGKPGKTVRQLKGIENHVKSGLGEQQFCVGSLTLHILVGLSQALFLEMTSCCWSSIQNQPLTTWICWKCIVWQSTCLTTANRTP